MEGKIEGKKSRGWHMIDMIGYDKAWPKEVDDDDEIYQS